MLEARRGSEGLKRNLDVVGLMLRPQPVFTASDRSNPITHEIYELLRKFDLGC